MERKITAIWSLTWSSFFPPISHPSPPLPLVATMALSALIISRAEVSKFSALFSKPHLLRAANVMLARGVAFSWNSWGTGAAWQTREHKETASKAATENSSGI